MQPNHSTDGEVSLRKSRKAVLHLGFLTKLWKACFLMSFPCRTLKIFVFHVTLDTDTKSHQGTVKSFKIQYFVLSAPLMGQNYGDRGFRGSLKNEYYRSACLTEPMHILEVGIEDWFARRTPLMPKHSFYVDVRGKDLTHQQLHLSLTLGSHR